MTTNIYYPDNVFIRTAQDLPDNCVFVFGSNYAGRHGIGAAKTAAWYFGAVYGTGQGFGIKERSYAIPTKDHQIKTLPLEEVKNNIDTFITVTQDVSNKDKTFFITKVGCGLAGFTSDEIAPLFKSAQSCIFPQSWKEYLE